MAAPRTAKHVWVCGPRAGELAVLCCRSTDEPFDAASDEHLRVNG
jgi:hypothetical protein